MPARLTRAAYLLCSAAFLFFILYSAPHQVHHFFDHYQQPSRAYSGDQHTNDNHRTPFANESNCVFQAAAQTCQLGFTALVQFVLTPPLINHLADPIESAIRQRFLPYAYQVRAPPEA